MATEYALDFALSHRKYLTFIVGGGAGLLINLLVTYAFTSLFSLWHMVSYVFGLAASIVFTFVYHRRLTFNKTSRTANRFIKFVMLTLVLAGLNWLLVYFATEIFLTFYLYAIIGVTLIISVINYYLNKIWVFRLD